MVVVNNHHSSISICMVVCDLLTKDNIQGQHLKVLQHKAKIHMHLTLKISSDQIWVAGYFGQPLTYPYFTIFSSDFLCNSLKK
jgi:hypothetical protein